MKTRRIIPMLLFSAVTFIALNVFQLWQDDQRAPLISNSRFVSELANGQVDRVWVAGRIVYVFDRKGGRSRTLLPSSQWALIADLQKRGVKVWVEKASGRWTTWLLTLESKLRFGS